MSHDVHENEEIVHTYGAAVDDITAASEAKRDKVGHMMGSAGIDRVRHQMWNDKSLKKLRSQQMPKPGPLLSLSIHSLYSYLTHQFIILINSIFTIFLD